MGKWKKTALGLTKDTMEYLSRMGRDVGAEGKGALGPLRRALGRVASLGEAVTKGVIEPEEGELCDLAKRSGAIKRKLMTLGKGLMVNQPPATAKEAHELISKAEEAIRSSQRTIKAALRGLGAASDISEASSLDVPPPLQRPVMGSLAASPACASRASEDNLLQDGRRDGQPNARARGGPGKRWRLANIRRQVCGIPSLPEGMVGLQTDVPRACKGRIGLSQSQRKKLG